MANTIQPFPGPLPFEREDRDYFFGRTRVASDLTSLIMAHQIVVLYAQSGAGKTSLLKAKVLSTLEQRKGFQVFPVARVKSLETDEKPTESSNTYMFNALRDLSDNALSASRRRELTLKQYLTDCPRPQNKSNAAYPTACPRVLVFDQFEELFTLYPERYLDRQKFFDELRDALNDDPRLRVVLSMREDYIAELDPYVHIFPDYLRTRFRMEKLRKDGAKQALVGPLNAFGNALGQPDAARMRFDHGVAEKLVDDLRKITVHTNHGDFEVEGEFVEPVHLQIVGKALFEKMMAEGHTVITEEHLETFGSVNRALIEYFEKAIGKAAVASNVSEGDLRRWCNRNLLTPENSRSTVLRRQHETAGLANTAIDVLETERVIRKETRDTRDWYELSHDKLIDPLRQSYQQWLVRQPSDEQLRLRLIARAEDWVASNRADTTLLLNQAEVEAAQPWVEEGAEGYDEALAMLVEASKTNLAQREAALYAELLAEQARSGRKLRWMVAGLVVMFLVAVGFAAEARRQRNKARSESAQALTARDEAEAQTLIAQGETAKATKAAQDLEDQKKIADQKTEDALKAQEEADAAAEEEKIQRKRADAATALAKQQTTLAVSSREAASAELKIAQEPNQIDMSVKKALGSVALNPRSIEAEHALRHSVSLLPLRLKKVDFGSEDEDFDFPDEGTLLVAFTPNRDIAAVDSAQIALFDSAGDPKPDFPKLEFDEDVTAIISADGRYAAIVGNGKAEITSLTNRNQRMEPICYGRETKEDTCGSGDADLNQPTFSPDGRYFAGYLQEKNRLRVWETATTDQVMDLGLAQLSENDVQLRLFSQRSFFAISGNGEFIAIADRERVKKEGAPGSETGPIKWRISVYRIADGHQLFQSELTNRFPDAFALSASGKYLASTHGEDSSAVQVWDVQTGKVTAQWIQQNPVNRIVFSPRENYVATVNANAVTVWKPGSGKEVSRVSHTVDVTGVAFNHDENLIATTARDQTTRLWDVKSGREFFRMGHDKNVASVSFSSDGKSLVTGSKDMRLWDLSSRGGDFEVSPGGRIRQAVVSHDGEYVAVLFDRASDSEADPTAGQVIQSGIQILRTRDGVEVKKWATPSRINRVTFSEDDTLLFAAPLNGTEITAWRWANAQKEGSYAFPRRVTSIGFGGNGQYAYGRESAGFLVMKITEQQVKSLPIRESSIRTPRLSFSYDGSSMLTYRYASTTQSEVNWWHLDWNSRTEKLEPARTFKIKPIGNMRVSRDGQYFAISDRSKQSYWSVYDRSGAPVKLGNSASEALSNVAFSPDSKLVTMASSERNVLMTFELSSGKLVHQITPEGTSGLQMFSPDGKLIITGGGGVKQIWQVSTGKEFARLGEETLTGFSPDYRYVFRPSDEGQSMIFSLLKLEDLILAACQRLNNRTLSKEEWRSLFDNERYRDVCSQK